MAEMFMFATGIENSSPTIDAGIVRVDEMETCGHYEVWRLDFEKVTELGIRFLRYGVPLHKVYLGAEHPRYCAQGSSPQRLLKTIQSLSWDPKELPLLKASCLGSLLPVSLGRSISLPERTRDAEVAVLLTLKGVLLRSVAQLSAENAY